ncbi:hypothetical protein ACFXKI_01385 [Streptomyces mirabilis]|uniref:hypothetical protein n=1 Tax=Streptomyces mirabilis TaxID=68239 RepID=UPI0036863EA9
MRLFARKRPNWTPPIAPPASNVWPTRTTTPTPAPISPKPKPPAPAEPPAGLIGRYATVGGGTVQVIERSGYFGRTEPTETHAACTACPARHTVEWGWSPWDEQAGIPQEGFDEGGKHSTPQAREWAQAHAEKCRAERKS